MNLRLSTPNLTPTLSATPTPTPTPTPTQTPTPTPTPTPTLTLQGGAFFPTGGSSAIAKTLVAAITRRGGRCFVRAPVSEIVIEGGRAVGVVVRSGYTPLACGFPSACYTPSAYCRPSAMLYPRHHAAPPPPCCARYALYPLNHAAPPCQARGVTMRARVAVISDAGFRNTFGCADADRAEHMGAPNPNSNP